MLLLFLKPEAPTQTLKGWIYKIYFRNNQYVIKLKTCNYTEIAFNKSLMEKIVQKQDKYVTLVCEVKGNQLHLKEIK